MMFRRFILSLVGCITVFLAAAQVGEHRNDLSIGFTGGYTMNKMDFVPKIKQSQKGSVMFGFSSRYVCEKYFTTICAVALEVQYNNLGWEEVIEDGSNNTYKRDWHFIEMPILMQLGWGRERRGFKFLFEAGPQVGLYLSGKEHRGGAPWDVSRRPNGVVYQYGKDPDNKFDYGIAAGLGLEFSSPSVISFCKDVTTMVWAICTTTANEASLGVLPTRPSWSR